MSDFRVKLLIDKEKGQHLYQAYLVLLITVVVLCHKPYLCIDTYIHAALSSLFLFLL